MATAIRDVQQHDLDAVLSLNNASGPTILPLDMYRIRWFFDFADYFRVALVNDQLAGFLIALREKAEYESPNFIWFRERYPEFIYIDRIVLAQRFRGLGLGRLFYSDVQSYAEVRAPLLACEVSLEPRDDTAVLFHGTFGFQEVGQQVLRGSHARVSLLAKSLPSYQFVHDTYLRHGKLPEVTWLQERVRRVSTSKARASGQN